MDWAIWRGMELECPDIHRVMGSRLCEHLSAPMYLDFLLDLVAAGIL